MSEAARRPALIIGAAGFVGGYLAAELARAALWDVYATKMPSETFAAPGVQVFDLDILEREAVAALVGRLRPAVIFHLAAQSSVAVAWKDPGLTVDVNVKGALNVLDAVRAAGLERQTRVLLIGSSEEYGAPAADEIPVKESKRPVPGNLYAATKAAQNEIGRIYAKAYRMDILSTRSFNHIGPGQSPIFVVADFCKQVAEIEAGLRAPLMQVGNLSAKRDFTDVRDVVRAYVLLAQKGVSGETYNVGSGSSVAIQEVLERILALSTAQIEVRTDPARLRPVDVPEVRADITKLREATGWTPEVPLETTLKETLDDWRGKAQNA